MGNTIGRMVAWIFAVTVLVAAPSWAADGARFVKLDANGKPLADGASEWTMIQDSKTELTWEVKTLDGSVHDRGNLYSWKKAEKEFIDALNKEQFGGFSDWRMPNREEILSIRDTKQDPNVDASYFPNTSPYKYWTYYICGDGSFITKKIKFGKGKRPGKGYHVRAVRGGSPTE